MYSSLDKSRQPATRSNTEKDIGSTQTSVGNANNSNGNNIPTDRSENRQISSKYDTNSGTAAKTFDLNDYTVETPNRDHQHFFSESPLSADDYLGNLPIKPLDDVAKSAFGANHETRNSSYKSLHNNIAGLSSQPLTSNRFSNNYHSALNEFTPKPNNKRTDQSSADGTGTEFTPLLKSTQKQSYERPDFDTTLTNKENRLGTKTRRGSNLFDGNKHESEFDNNTGILSYEELSDSMVSIDIRGAGKSDNHRHNGSEDGDNGGLHSTTGSHKTGTIGSDGSNRSPIPLKLQEKVIDNLNIENFDLKLKIATLEAQVGNLNLVLENKGIDSTYILNIQRRETTLIEQLTQIQRAYSKLKIDFKRQKEKEYQQQDNKDAGVSELRNLLEAAEDEREDLIVQLHNTENRFDHLQNRFERQRENYEELLMDQRLDYEEQIKQLNQDLKNKHHFEELATKDRAGSKDYASDQQDLEDLRKTLNDKENDITRLQKELQDREEELDRVQSHANSLENKIDTMEEDLDDKNEQFKALEQELDYHEEKMDDAKERFEKLQQELYNREEELDEAKDHSKKLQQTIRDLEQQLKDSEAMQQSLRSVNNNTSDQVREKNDELLQTVQTVRQKLNRKELEIAELENQLEKIQDDYESLQNEHDQFEHKTKAVIGRLREEIEQQNQELQDAISREQNIINKQSSQSERLYEARKEQDAKSLEMQSKINELRTHNSQLTSKLGQIEKENYKYKKQISDLEGDKVVYQAGKSSLDIKVANLERELEKEKQKREGLEKSLEANEEDYNAHIEAKERVSFF